ncbi:unnamed protein product, partial [marine sediment metagenome]
RDMLRLKIIDRIIPEPIGGAQNVPGRMVKIVKKYIIGALERFAGISGEELKSRRAKKFESMGFFGTE